MVVHPRPETVWAKLARALQKSLVVAALVDTGCFATVQSSDPGPAQPSIETLPAQEILTPVPVRVRLPSRLGADRVELRFRTRGSRDWTTTLLARTGQTWSGEVPCREVSTITGELQYFVVARDGDGRAVVSSGNPAWPHVTLIENRLLTGPASLLGAPRLLRCPDPADCPPGFPGCAPAPPLRPECDDDDDCRGGYCAWDGYCATSENPA